ncbi:MAG: single-stranded DNA-binding protein [bacterium]|nr:single-stranded DNA-binding protein [bacterium]
MKSLINSVRLMGHVGATPEVKSFDNGNKVAKVKLATNEKQKNAKGETVDITYWHSLVFWGKQAELIEKYISKGERLAIEGTLTNRSYETKTGEKKQVTEVRVDTFEFVSRKAQTANSMKESTVADDLPF